jgi:hypothetical protein
MPRRSRCGRGHGPLLDRRQDGFAYCFIRTGQAALGLLDFGFQLIDFT